MGVPQTITSDRDSKFGASIWKTIIKRLAIKHHMATARHQRTDGQTENMVKQVKTALTKLFDQGETQLETLLPYLEFALNNSINQTTGFTPFYLAYGYHPQEFADIDLIEEPDRAYDLGDRMA
jgi:transposase InsO family protein